MDEGRMTSDRDVFEVLRRHTAPGTALGAKLTGRGAVEVDGKGATVHLSDGRSVLDFGSYGVALLGHRHPDVIAAVTDQLGRMPTATRTLANPVLAGFVSDLIERLQPPLERVWLGSDGADAVEVATKLARRASGRPRLLAVMRGFHGKTMGALALTWNPPFREGLSRVLGNVTHIDPADPDAVLRETAPGDVAALVLEPIQGEAGVIPLDPIVLRRWAEDAHAAGAYVISDEIQAGLRRCGPICVALELGIRPDAVLLGKALGGGVMPLSAMVANDDLYGPLAADPTWHTATFGGHPLACAAGRAALRAIDELRPRAGQIAARFERGLRELAVANEDVVVDVRGAGLLWGIEFSTAGAAGSVLVELGQRGVLVSPCLSAKRTIRLLPPMIATDEQLDRVLAVLAESVEASTEYAEDAAREAAPYASATS
jgi:putrescine aminotransferase